MPSVAAHISIRQNFNALSTAQQADQSDAVALDTLPAGSREALKELAAADQGKHLIGYDMMCADRTCRKLHLVMPAAP